MKNSDIRLKGNHFPCKISLQTNKTVYCDGSDGRSKCKLCSKKSSTFCSTCKVFLCLGDDKNIGCWGTFHTCETFED